MTNTKYRTCNIYTNVWPKKSPLFPVEYHHFLECSSLNEKRKQLLPKYFMKIQNVVKFLELLSSQKQAILRKLCIFIKHINKVFVLLACQLLFLHPFTLLSVYIVNSFVIFLLFCYFFSVPMYFGCMRIKI